MRETILALAVTLGVCLVGCLADSVHRARQLSELLDEPIPPLAGLFLEVDPAEEALLMAEIERRIPDYMKKDRDTAEATEPAGALATSAEFMD